MSTQLAKKLASATYDKSDGATYEKIDGATWEMILAASFKESLKRRDVQKRLTPRFGKDWFTSYRNAGGVT